MYEHRACQLTSGREKIKDNDAGRGEVLADPDGNGLDLLQCSGDGSANPITCIIHIVHRCLSLASGLRACDGVVHVSGGGKRSWHQGARRQQGGPCRGTPEAGGTRLLHACTLYPAVPMAGPAPAGSPPRPAPSAASLAARCVPCCCRWSRGEGRRRQRRRPSQLRPAPPPLLDGGEGSRRPST